MRHPHLHRAQFLTRVLLTTGVRHLAASEAIMLALGSKRAAAVAAALAREELTSINSILEFHPTLDGDLLHLTDLTPEELGKSVVSRRRDVERALCVALFVRGCWSAHVATPLQRSGANASSHLVMPSGRIKFFCDVQNREQQRWQQQHEATEGREGWSFMEQIAQTGRLLKQFLPTVKDGEVQWGSGSRGGLCWPDIECLTRQARDARRERGESGEWSGGSTDPRLWK